MNWVVQKLELLAEWLYSLRPIHLIWGIPLGTLILAIGIINSLFFIVDSCFLVELCPRGKMGLPLLISVYLGVWLSVMYVFAVFIIKFGSHILRYVIIRNRVDDLKNSGLVNRTNQNISLIGLSLYPFASQPWMDTFEEKLINGVKVRLLFVDPRTEYAKTRHSSLRSHDEKLCDDILKAIKIFKDFKLDISKRHGDLSNNIEMRMYKSNASMSTFMFLITSMAQLLSH